MGRVSKVLLLMALMAALFPAGTGAAAEGEIVFNLAVEPQTIDPVRNNAVDGSNMTLAVAFHAVRAVGLLAHGVQVQAPQELLDLLKRAAALNLDLQPLGLAYRCLCGCHGPIPPCCLF